MKNPLSRIILITAATVLAGALVYYFAAIPAAPLADSQTRKASPAPANAKTPDVRPQATVADVPATGHDGPVTTAPVRQADALTDAPRTSPALAPGAPATAWVEVGDRRTEALEPDQFGAFQHVYVSQKAEARVRVRLPESEPGGKIIAAVEDGGTIEEGKPAVMLTVDENREIAFKFTGGMEPGNYRVSLRIGGDRKLVQFWVNAPKTAAAH